MHLHTSSSYTSPNFPNLLWPIDNFFSSLHHVYTFTFSFSLITLLFLQQRIIGSGAVTTLATCINWGRERAGVTLSASSSSSAVASACIRGFICGHKDKKSQSTSCTFWNNFLPISTHPKQHLKMCIIYQLKIHSFVKWLTHLSFLTEREMHESTPSTLTKEDPSFFKCTIWAMAQFLFFPFSHEMKQQPTDWAIFSDNLLPVVSVQVNFHPKKTVLQSTFQFVRSRVINCLTQTQKKNTARQFE